jgi:uncharacterized membrane protein YiaA
MECTTGLYAVYLLAVWTPCPSLTRAHAYMTVNMLCTLHYTALHKTTLTGNRLFSTVTSLGFLASLSRPLFGIGLQFPARLRAQELLFAI